MEKIWLQVILLLLFMVSVRLLNRLMVVKQFDLMVRRIPALALDQDTALPYNRGP